MNRTAFCITGWHFPIDLYRSFSTIPGVDLFVVSHKGWNQIPDEILEFVDRDRILVRPNLGYDWGCYQQFIKTGLWKEYQTVFFMHDDIDIHDLGFVEKTQELLKKHAVVGNGVGEGSVSYTSVNKHPYAYAHSIWKPETFHYQHYTVRGSFLATTRDVLERIGSFEVYWDPFRLNLGFGNWSTKATCGKLEELYGPNCFGFLSHTFGVSKYLTELYRGERGVTPVEETGWKADLYAFLKRISTIYLEIYFRERKVRSRWLWLLAFKLFLGLFSGRFHLLK